MRVTFEPCTLRGTVEAPPSKSMAHRMLICAGLAEGESLIRPVDPSEDILATLDGLRALGATADREGTSVRVRGCRPEKAASAVLPCRECGSTLRFLIPLCLRSGQPMRLTGSPTLLSRPLTVYEELCRERGFRFERDREALTVAGRLTPGTFEVAGGISSQFISGLLFALPGLEEDSRIRLIPPVESRSYVEMTLEALADFGVHACWEDELTLRVPGGAAFQAGEYTVEGDYSNAAFLAAFRATGHDITVTGLRQDSAQGDRVFEAFLARLPEGCPTLDVSDCPDLAPVLLAVAALCGGAVLTGTRRLQMKESDRGAAMAEELAKFGIRLEREENEIRVLPGSVHPPAATLRSHNDHRIAMALSVLCVRTGGMIEGAEAVRKSWPDYWKRLKELGGRITVEQEKPEAAVSG